MSGKKKKGAVEEAPPPAEIQEMPTIREKKTKRAKEPPPPVEEPEPTGGRVKKTKRPREDSVIPADADIKKASGAGGGGEKKGKKKKEKKKPKLSKKKQEALKAAEEEARRLQEIEDAKQARIRAKQQRIEKRLKLNRERRTRKAELPELATVMRAQEMALRAYLREKRLLAAWERFLRCDGTPDPASVQEMNMYIGQRLSVTDRDDARCVMEDMETDLKLLEELEYLRGDSRFKPKGLINHYGVVIKDLQALVMRKLDLGTFQVLCDASELVNNEPVNLHHVVDSPSATLCIWGNLSLNARVKQQEFKELGITFDIPRPLALVYCAIRVLYMNFDFISPTSYGFELVKLKGQQVIPSTLVETGTVSAVPEDQAKRVDYDLLDLKEPKEAIDNMSIDDTRSMAESSADILRRKSTRSGTATGLPRDDVDIFSSGRRNVMEDEESEYEFTPEPPLDEHEDIYYHEDILDLRTFRSVGGVYKIDALTLPPQPRQVKGWTVTVLVDPPRLEPMEYMAHPELHQYRLGSMIAGTEEDLSRGSQVLSNQESSESTAGTIKDTSTPPVGLSATSGGGLGSTSKQQKEKKDRNPPILVTFQLPKHACVLEDLVIGKWDEKELQWRRDGFAKNQKEPVYDPDTRTVTFRMNSFGTVACFQDVHNNMPFESWEIRPHSPNSAVLTIIAAISEVEIEIKDDLCCLSQPMDAVELETVRNKWVAPHILVRMLRSVGLNLFPEPDADRYVDISDKDRYLVEKIYRQMAMTIGAMAFSWSKWNAETYSKDKVVIQVAEAVEESVLMEAENKGEDDPEHWFLVLITKMSCERLSLTEFDERWKEDVVEGSAFHSNLYHLVLDTASQSGLDKVATATPQFINCVERILNLTQLLTFS